jgi:ABC-type microcin C transport system duplicated ATPase subunit YejF
VELLRDLQRRRGLAYLFISHDLRVVRAMSHEVVVMKDGVVVEAGPTQAIFERRGRRIRGADGSGVEVEAVETTV